MKQSRLGALKAVFVVSELIRAACAGAEQPPMPAVEQATLLAATTHGMRTVEGMLPQGARWHAEIPVRWNGTLLLWSHGYSPRIDPPTPAPPEYRESLLAAGYGLLASDYGAGGWALAEAVPAQRDALLAVIAQIGRPRRVIAWGASMGGLVTTALAEQSNTPIDGALALCPSIGGAVGMMNMALDGAFAFRTLVAPAAGIELTRVRDDAANTDAVRTALAHAMTTSEGRARIALAGVLAGIPSWTRPDHPPPDARDHDGQVEQIAATFAMAVFPPRQEQEARAGGASSWNTGIDYGHQLDLSGRRAFVAALYRRAGLDLEQDLARLQAAPRVKADPLAVDYLLAHYTPTARPLLPILSLQAVGDGITSPSLQRAYLEAADKRMAHGLWFDGAGHCRFPASAVLSALNVLEKRIEAGRWPPRPAGMIEHRPAPMLRPCLRRLTCR